MVTSVVTMAEPYHHRPNWDLLAVIPIATALGAGFVTPLAALLAVGVQLLRFTSSHASLLSCGVPILYTLALAILGPGAYSVDALLFGRRLLLTNRDE
jgi:hypothetical protein